MNKLIFAALIGLSFTSCKKETNIYYPSDPVQAVQGENYDLPKGYIGSHDWFVVSTYVSPMNEEIAWKLQGLDKNGNTENYFLIMSNKTHPELPNVFWKYKPGQTIESYVIEQLTN